MTILGFIGKDYVDEDNQKCTPKNSNFSLKDLKILKEYNFKKFINLPEKLQNKILDFEIFVVEIEERLNPKFNPIDLFVRLNDKPYPIRENSFEMWNSWAEREVITQIRENVKKHKEWFYLKLAKKPSDRDRMENEEIYTCLVYLEYQKSKKENIELDIYSQSNRINARISSTREMTNILTTVSEDPDSKKIFVKSIQKVEKFIKNVKTVLLDKNINKEELSCYLYRELDNLYKARKESRSFRRTKQDFYILWYILSPINPEMLKYHRLNIKKEIQEIFFAFKNMSEKSLENSPDEQFKSLINEFHQKYQQEERKVKLSDSEKEDLVKQQNNICPISGAPIFIGDEIEVDHNKPLAIGGKDTINNLQAVHKDSNRMKGINYSE